MEKEDNRVTEPGAASVQSSHSTAPQILTLNTNKAGMEGLDTERINEIIKTASEGSRFYQHKQRCQQQLDNKILGLKQAAASFTHQHVMKATLQMDQLMEELEVKRDLSHTIVHIDMDMFYAAVEMRDDPSLRDKPMAVGGLGMLSTSNYAARKFGVRAAMPGFIGKKLCPDLVIVPPNFTKYKQVSKEIHEVFSEYDANFCSASLDEAYLDITDYMNKNASRYDVDKLEDSENGRLSKAIVEEIREKIFSKTQLTASAGIAANTRLAKICSDMNKPNGQFYLASDREEIFKFVSTLPIRKVSGIGSVMEQQLQALDISVCSHLIEKRGLLKLLFSDNSYNTFINIALGLGHTTLESWTEKDRKSISTETTFRNTADKATLFKLIEELCKELADEMEQKTIVGKAFTLKLKTSDFQIRTRTQTLPDATCALDVMVSTARRLLQHEMSTSVKPLSLRLLGVRMSVIRNSSEMGPSRQTTLTQMFSRSLKPKMNSTSDLMRRTFVKDKFNCAEDQSHLKNSHQYDAETLALATTSETQSSCQQDTNLITCDAVKVNNHSAVDDSTPIECFLAKPGDTSDSFQTGSHECPVCGKFMKVINITDFIMHVDACCKNIPLRVLDKKISIGSDNKDINVSENKIQIISESDSSDLGHSSKSNDSNKYWQSDNEQDFKRCENLHDLTKKEYLISTNTGMPEDPITDFLCPVCEQKQFKTLESLNMHVDECLSCNTINEILQEGTIQPKQSGCNQVPSIPSVASCSECASQSQVAGKRKGNNSNKGKKKVKIGSNTLEKYFSS